MKFSEIVGLVLALLQRQGRVSYRALKRDFELDDDLLADLKEELLFTYAEHVRDEDPGLVWVSTSLTSSVQGLASTQVQGPRAMLDHPIVSSRYFFPRREFLPEPYWVEAADGSRLACYYQAAHPDAKTVIYFHGNGEVVADYLPSFPEWLVRAGCNVLMAEYRGYGMSSGTPTLAGMLDDVVPIIQSLKIPDLNVILFGRSIGSLYALHGVSQRPQLGGLIIESGVADLTERFFLRVAPEELGVSESAVIDELRTYFDYSKKLGGFQGQTLILHARHDELLPARHGEMLYAAAPEPKQLKIFDHGGHNDIFYRNQREYMQLVEEFVGKI